MSKNRTSVNIAGHDFSLTSDDGEEYVAGLARYVDRKIRETQEEYPSISSATAYLLVALNLADELHKVKSNYDALDSRLSQLLSAQVSASSPMKRPFETKTPTTTK